MMIEEKPTQASGKLFGIAMAACFVYGAGFVAKGLHERDVVAAQLSYSLATKSPEDRYYICQSQRPDTALRAAAIRKACNLG